jgi:hypothetical protein
MQTRTYDETKCKLVPREATDRQMKAAHEHSSWIGNQQICDLYKAMVAAAGEPPQEA